MVERTRLHFKRTGWHIDLNDCAYIAKFMPLISLGWDIVETKYTTSKLNLRTSVSRRRKNTWTWASLGKPKYFRPRDWDKIPPKTEMRVLTDVHEAAIHWYLDDNPNLISLHCASAKIGKGVIVFPARGRAGKSTLMAALAARGMRLFGDDVMLINRGRAMAYGFAPRLRVPLPKSMSRNVKNYIAENTIVADQSWLYLSPGARGLAPLGEISAIAAFILLERVETGPIQLTPIREVDVLKSLVLENISRTLPLHLIFDRLQRLAKNKPRFKMTYSDTEEAAAFLCKHFGAE